MEKIKNSQKKSGEPGYLNKNCWLIRSLNYAPYGRCQYCELKFHNCLFLHYQITSAILLTLILVFSFLIERKNSEFLIIVVFTLVIVYGYFFNKSTDKIIKANFSQRKANEALEELTQNLQKKVDEQTEEIKKAYEVEKKAHKELKKLNEVKNQFIMATQHHLRTPLTSMQGYLELLIGGSFGRILPNTKKTLQKFQASTRTLIKIVNEFLDISQFQLGKGVVALQPNIQIESILKAIIKELQFEAETKNLYLKFQKPEKTPEIKAGPEKLKVALFNIIDNALKYTQKGGVTIIVKSINDKIQIIIQDTGIGMSEEVLETLFTETFTRGKEAQKLFTTGRGIGLFITSQIIKAHHGKVWAESKGQGKGSTFYVELPIQ